MVLVSVIVPNYQGREVFPNCLRSLLKQTFDDFEIVFVDDGSSDGSYEYAKKLFGKEKKIKLFPLKKNSGYVGAINHGFKNSQGEYVVVTNNDATFNKEWVAELYKTVEKKPKVVGSSMVVQVGNEKATERQLKRKKTGVFSVLVASTTERTASEAELTSGRFVKHANGVLIIPRRALKNFVFLQDYYMYGEDTELCWRLRLQGYTVVLNSNARMYHIGSFTRKHVPAFNKNAVFHGTKNTVQNFLVFYEARNLVALAPWFFAVQGIMLLTNPRQIFTRLRAHWWVASHMHKIMKRRKDMQRNRKVSDQELFKLMTYKLYDESFAPTKLTQLFARTANGLLRIYCKVWGIRTFDMNDKNAIPVLDEELLR